MFIDVMDRLVAQILKVLESHIRRTLTLPLIEAVL